MGKCVGCTSYYPGCSPKDCIEYTEDFRPRFEQVSSSPDAILPVRATESSAGYDLYSNSNITLEPFHVTLVPTGIKVKLPTDKYLSVSLRSSIAIKQTLIMPNAPGVIDADYYNNETNEGEIMVPILNLSATRVEIDKHQRIAQGIVMKYYKAYKDHAMATRTGGFGSTNK